MPARILQSALLAVCGGGVAILLGIGGTAVALAGLGAMALGTVLSAPGARGPGRGWWTLVAAGVLAAGAGEGLALVTGTFGGLLSALGVVTAMAGAFAGFPAE